MTRETIILLAKGYLPDDGGIERYSTEIARGYAQNGYRVIALTQSGAGPGVRRDGRVAVVDLGRGNQAALMIRFLFVWRRLRHRFKPVIVHATTWRLSLPALFGGRRPPLVVTVHGREIFVMKAPLRPVMRHALGRADRVLVVSDAIRQEARARAGLASGPWRVVWNGASYLDGSVETGPRPAGTPSSPVRIATLCRLVGRKNVPGAVRAAGLLLRRGVTDFRYEIAGGGPDLPAVEREIAANGLQNYVVLLGRVDDEEVPVLYARSDIFLHPQIDLDGDIEGFGLVIADAMTLGAAVVAGRDGGPADFVQPGVTGLLVDGTDDAAIADALELLITQPGRRAEIAEAGRRWAHDTLSWANAAAQGIEGLSGPTGGEG